MHWNNTEIFFAAFGGSLIALSSSLNLYLTGNVTGMSGIFRSLFSIKKPEFLKNFSLFSGLVASTSFLFSLFGYEKSAKLGITLFDKPQNIKMSTLTYLFGGILIGVGSKMQNGCTTGHGACGLPRFNLRSWVVVPIFLTSAFIVENLKRIIPGFQKLTETEIFSLKSIPILSNLNKYVPQMLAISILPLLYSTVNYFQNKKEKQRSLESIINYVVGTIFGLGLCLSGMTKQSKIQAFLSFDSKWDPSLFFVLGTAVLLNMISFNFIKKYREQRNLSYPKTGSNIDKKLIIGAILFGMGWGLGSICPGNAMAQVHILEPHQGITWLTGMYIGHCVLAK